MPIQSIQKLFSFEELVAIQGRQSSFECRISVFYLSFITYVNRTTEITDTGTVTRNQTSGNGQNILYVIEDEENMFECQFFLFLSEYTDSYREIHVGPATLRMVCKFLFFWWL